MSKTVGGRSPCGSPPSGRKSNPKPMHALRHTYAALLIAAGHNPKYLQHQMGRGSVQITLDLYGHLYDEANREAAKKTEAFYKTESKKAVERIAEVQKNVVGIEGADGLLKCVTKPSQSQRKRVSFCGLTQ